MNGGQRQEAGAHALQEIDIVENIGAPHPEPEWAKNWHRQMTSNTHYHRTVDGKTTALSAGQHAPLDPPAAEAFHTYGAWWVDANTVRIYPNDIYQFTLHPRTDHSEKPLDRPMHVNMVCESYDWMMPPAKADLTNPAINTAYYDWVRAHRMEKVAETGAPEPQRK